MQNDTFKFFIKSLKFSWFKRLVTGAQTSWKFLLMKDKDLKGKNLLHFGADFYEQCSRNMTNCFWKEVFSVVGEVIKSFSELHIRDEFLFEPIWYNKHVMIDKKTIFYTECYKKVLLIFVICLMWMASLCHIKIFVILTTFLHRSQASLVWGQRSNNSLKKLELWAVLRQLVQFVLSST